MAREQIISLPSDVLRAIVRSTSESGRYALERMWAMDELARRNR
jgi:hypothetical protein